MTGNRPQFGCSISVRHGLLPVVDEAEFVSLRVFHQAPAIAVLVVIVVRDPPAAEVLNPGGGSIDMIDRYVKMKPVLGNLRLRYPLKTNPWPTHRCGCEVHILWWIPKPILDVDAKHFSPKQS